jgi:bifunctional DNA-binding transcriptional regulator/antitoxin component of YhaV-PrlF toxin-antitoxin module
MSEKEELKIGRRGEIYTTRRIRMKTGLTPGGKAIAIMEENRLIVQPKPTALTLLEKPRINPKPLSPEELSWLRREISKEIETR